MMRKELSFTIILLLITTNLIIGQNENLIDTNIVKQNIRKINSIQSSSDNSDLSFLNNELKEVEILMLGEQSHRDGSTFMAKTRLIKYLHENQKFNVLVFESGLADVYRVWRMIQENNKDIKVFDYGIFPVWTKSKQTKELFEYILEQSKTNNPLYIAGFDMQPTGTITPEKRWDELNTYLKQAIDFKEDNYPLFSKVISNIRIVFSKEFTKNDFETLNQEFQEIIQIVSKNDTSQEGKIMSRYIENFFKTIILYTNADLRQPSNTPHVFNIRDKVMAENLTFLKEEVYPHQKFMVWGANSHLGYGRGFLEDFQEIIAQGKGMIPMGQYLKIDYQDKLYTLAFTSYEGSVRSLNGGITVLEPAHNLTLESNIASLGFEIAFLSMKDQDIKMLRFPARIYGHVEMNGIWGQMCDGIFFIRTMTPNEIEK